MLGLMSKRDYKELADFIAQRFDRVEQRLDKIESRLEGVEQRLYGIEGKMDEMTSTLDSQSKYFQEQEMIKGQLDRHDGWIHKIAKDTGTALEY